MEAVGLMFTDVRDKLFLGELVKRRMPDVQLFTYGGHLLYARADRRDWLNGMLVFSTYPLVLDSQWWLKSDTAQSRMAFPTDGAEGTYNATLLLLERSNQMLDYGGPSDTSNLPGRPARLSTASGMGERSGRRGDVSAQDVSRLVWSRLVPSIDFRRTVDCATIVGARLICVRHYRRRTPVILSVTSLTLLYRRVADRVTLARAIQRWLRTKRSARGPVWVPTEALVQLGPTLVALRFMFLAPWVRHTKHEGTAVRDPSFGYQIVLQFQRLMYLVSCSSASSA